MAYRVVDDTSTRASADPASPEYEEWVHFRAGQRVSKWPEHAPVDQWVASGHWVEVPTKAEPSSESPAPVGAEPAGTTGEEVTDGED